MTVFSEIAKVKLEELPVVLPLPPAWYYAEGFKQPETKTTAAGRGVMVNFTMKIIAPHENYEDMKSIKDYVAEMGPVTGTVRTLGFYYPHQVNPETQNADDLKRLQARAIADIRKFLERTCGLKGEDLGELMAQYPGTRFIVDIVHQQDRLDPSQMVERIGQTMPMS